MVAEIFGSLSAFKSMLDIAKGLKDINDAAIRAGVAIELQEKILTAREAQSAALDRIHDLEQEIMQFKDWENEKGRYKLTDIGVGSYVYALKEAMKNGEPPHYLCTRCYDEKRKQVLQYRFGTHPGIDFRMHIWDCPYCKLTIRMIQESPPVFAEGE